MPAPDRLSPAPLVLGDNNVWPLALDASEGGGWLLVDAGLDDEAADVASWDALVAQLRAQGIEPPEVRVVVLTHEHIDHAGLAGRWAGLGARIVVGRAGMPVVALGAEANERQREARFSEVMWHGAPSEVIETWRAVQRTRSLRWPPCPEGALEAAEARRTFRLDEERTLRLVMAPGHTPGNLVAFVPETGDLFSGDTVIPTTIPTPGLHFPGAVLGDEHAPRWPSLPPFLRSVAAVRALVPTRVYPGHGEVIEEPGVYLDRFEAHHARRAHQVHEVLTEGEAMTAFEVTKAIYRRLPDARLMQAMTEVLGHLDLLEESGAASRIPAGNQVRWRLVEVP